MKLRKRSTVLPFVAVAFAMACSTTYGDSKEGKATQPQRLPAYERMLATALKHNPSVRSAQAQLDGARLQVAKEIRAFRQEWQEQRTKVASAELAARDAERLSSLRDGVVAGRKTLEAKRLAQSSQQQATLAIARLSEMKKLLPLLLGIAEAQQTGHSKTSQAQQPPKDRETQHAQHDGHNHEPHALPAEVVKLLRQRIDALTQAAKLQQSAYQKGEVRFSEVAAAQTDVLTAKLELAKKPHERIQILKETLQIVKQIEKATATLSRAEETSVVDVLKAKALRLRVEADLRREQLTHTHDH